MGKIRTCLMSDDLWKQHENILYGVEYLLIIFLKKEEYRWCINGSQSQRLNWPWSAFVGLEGSWVSVYVYLRIYTHSYAHTHIFYLKYLCLPYINLMKHNVIMISFSKVIYIMQHFILISKSSVMMNIAKGVNNDFLLKKTLLLLNMMNSLNSSEDMLCIAVL